MEEVQAIFDSVVSEDYPVKQMRVLNKVYEELSMKNSGKTMVNLDTLTKIRRMFDFLMEGTTSIFKENIELKTQLAVVEKHNRELTKLLSNISERAQSVPEVSVEKDVDYRASIRKPEPEQYTIICKPLSDDTDLGEFKKSIRQICIDEEFPEPGDVITTRNREVILKMKTDKELTETREALNAASKNKFMVRTAFKRRERIIILGVHEEADQVLVEKSIERTLDMLRYRGPVDLEVMRRLSALGKGDDTEHLEEDIRRELFGNIRTVRQYLTKSGTRNWIMDVDKVTSEILLEKKRICIDFERYRVVRYVPVVRCFKCQAYGHMSRQCSGAQVCAKCAGDHDLKNCDSSTIRCGNCYSKDQAADCSHMTTSRDCPVFLDYKKSLGN